MGLSLVWLAFFYSLVRSAGSAATELDGVRTQSVREITATRRDNDAYKDPVEAGNGDEEEDGWGAPAIVGLVVGIVGLASLTILLIFLMRGRDRIPGVDDDESSSSSSEHEQVAVKDVADAPVVEKAEAEYYVEEEWDEEEQAAEEEPSPQEQVIEHYGTVNFYDSESEKVEEKVKHVHAEDSESSIELNMDDD
jgi:hypothetical protein